MAEYNTFEHIEQKGYCDSCGRNIPGKICWFKFTVLSRPCRYWEKPEEKNFVRLIGQNTYKTI